MWWDPVHRSLPVNLASSHYPMKSVFRKIGCVLTALGSLLALYSASWYGWLTVAGSPEQGSHYRLMYYLSLAAAPICYGLLALLLRPKPIVLFVFNTLVCLLWVISLGCAADSDVMKGALVVSTLYLLWRGMEAVRCSERDC